MKPEAYSLAIACISAAVRLDVGEASLADTKHDIDKVLEDSKDGELANVVFALSHLASTLVVARCDDAEEDPFAYLSEVALAVALRPLNPGDEEA